MNEIKRLQQLAGILSEIKVNVPSLKNFNGFFEVLDFFGGELPMHYGDAKDEANRKGYNLTPEEFYEADQNSQDINEIKVNNPTLNPIINKYKSIIDQAIKEWKNLGHNNAGDDLFNYVCKTLDYNDNSEGWDDDFEGDDEYNFESDLILYSKNINEDVSGFKRGDTTDMGYSKSVVTDVDNETQSVSWDIKKDVDDDDIYKDLTALIKKFDSIQLKDFHSRPKLIQLVKDLKTIRNKFSRTIPK